MVISALITPDRVIVGLRANDKTQLLHDLSRRTRLHRPIDFQAIDEKPVDLVFLLLIPANAGGAHVSALADISRHLRDQTFAARLRHARTAAELYSLLAAA